MRFYVSDYEFVFQWSSHWWRFPRHTWVKYDKGHWSLAIRFFWLEFLFFW